MQYHFIGIGGAGMSVVAELLFAAGARVTGSDRSASTYTEHLAKIGILAQIGHDAKNVPADAVVVYSSAIKSDNPELQIAKQRGQSIIHRSQALAIASEGKDFIAVAGAHGKSSTSALIASALGDLGLDPSRAIGSTLAGGISGGYRGTGSVIVAEADESDGSFLNYRPRIAVVMNVEPDHLDHYGSKEKFAQAFLDFAKCIVPGGVLICGIDDAGAAQLAQAASALGIRVQTYGIGEKPDYSEKHAQLDFADPSANSDDACSNSAVVRIFAAAGSTEMKLSLQLPGKHMLLNGVGALLAGLELGISAPQMAQGLFAFRGIERRFEIRGEVAGIKVIDDYAHHPTEISATLTTAREICPGKVHVLFQPHLYSRTTNFKHEFARSLALADSVVITRAYAARETKADGDDGDVIAELLPGSSFLAEMEEAARMIATKAAAGDYIFTMGAGDVTELGSVIMQELRTREN